MRMGSSFKCHQAMERADTVLARLPDDVQTSERGLHWNGIESRMRVRRSGRHEREIAET